MRVGPTMTFGLEDKCPLQTPHNDALVIQLKIATTMVHRVLVDITSSIDIITLECLKKYNEKDLEVVETPVVRFRGQATYPLGTKGLPVRRATRTTQKP